MPTTTAYIQRLFGSDGVYPYLANYLDPTADNYQVVATDVPLVQGRIFRHSLGEDLSVSAIPVHHGPIAAVAWRVDVLGCSMTFSGDMNNAYQALADLAADTDLLVVHAAVPDSASGVATRLHMTPRQLGEVAAKAKARGLVLSHIMRRSDDPQALRVAIKRSYAQPVFIARDLERFELGRPE